MANVYDVPGLAAHWGCSTDTIYNLVNSGDLPSFKLGGKLIRIRADEVERYECRNIPSNDTGADSPSSGPKAADAAAIRLERMIDRPQRQRLARSGNGAQ